MGELAGGSATRNATGLPFPELAGCAGSRDGHDDGLHPCVTPPMATVKHRLERPRPHTVRVFVCEAHAVGQPDPRPLTEADRAELRRRRRRATSQPRRRPDRT